MRRLSLIAVSALSVLGFAAPLNAVIVATGDGTQNSTSAGTVSQFNNVARVGDNGSAIYLGNGAVLTANHVGPGTTTLNGINYAPVFGSEQRVLDPITNDPTDMTLYRIVGPPVLPTLTISNSTPGVGTFGYLIGNGRTRETNKRYWDVTGGVWTDQGTNPAGAEASGYNWTGPGIVRWGSNATENVALIGEPAGATATFSTGDGDIRGLITQFHELSNEGQAAGGDSGGAFFASDGTLMGMMFGRLDFVNQPGNTSVFGDVTAIADLSYYREQINNFVAAPEPGAIAMIGVALICGLSRRRR